MRARAALLALALAAPAAAGPLDRAQAPPMRAQPDASFSAAAQREAEESANRQAAFDRRISDRSNRAARSICTGCGPGAGSSATVTPPGVRREREEAALPRDPAQAPLD